MHLPFSPGHLWPLVVLSDRALRGSVRWTVSDPEGELARATEEGARLFVCRHGQLWPLLWAVEGCDVGVLVSRSGDGELLARVLSSRGFRLLRGSSSREGSIAARLAIRELLAGRNVGLAVDGPRGPRGLVQDGPLRIAQRTGARVIPLRVQGPGRWVLRGTWDAFEIPRPLGELRVHVDPGFEMGSEPDALARARRTLERALDPAFPTASEATPTPSRRRGASVARPG